MSSVPCSSNALGGRLRVLWVFLAVVAGPVFAGDRVLSEREWVDAWITIIGSDKNQFARLEELKRTAEACVVERRAKLISVSPSRTKEPGENAVVAYVVCREIPLIEEEVNHVAGRVRLTRSYGGSLVRIPVRRKEAGLVEGWNKWDLLAWRLRPSPESIWDDGLPPLDAVDSLAGIVRTPNPGPEWPDFQKGGELAAWLERWNAATEKRDYEAAFKMLTAARGKALRAVATCDPGAAGTRFTYWLEPKLRPMISQGGDPSGRVTRGAG